MNSGKRKLLTDESWLCRKHTHSQPTKNMGKSKLLQAFKYMTYWEI